ncbi:MAG TPA: response regulator [Aquabacterium sp.]|uniref:response regulator n=1 Tax=Aquabacterium sp. TaxID=1872578 RepID=UPI002E343024|nr:response regulator [Aquabacterium sp.]HEX5373625.1 response regulator [Aquabacterium sp.]
MATILVVDDELGIRALLSDILTDEGHTVEVAENAAQARTMREQCKPDLVLLDIWMPDVDGVTLLKEWGANGQLTMPVIMMSGHGTIDTAVEATKVGAQAFLEKPITMQKLLRAVEQGLAKPSAAAPTTGKPLGLSGTPHLASVTPITAAPSYVQQPSAPQLMAVRSNDLGIAGLTTSSSMSSGVGGMHHGGHVGAPALGGGLAHEQLFELDRPLREARDDFERAYFEFHLAREGGSMTRVAEKTGLERTHLYRKLKQLGVDLTRNRKTAVN